MKSISLNIYCDEIVNVVLDDIFSEQNEYWTYLGVLLVPTHKQDELLRELLNSRCLADGDQNWRSCDLHCGYHDDNNTEVHYSELDDTRKYRVASSWIDFLLRNGEQDKKLVYFYILGLNLTNLDLEKFGPTSQQNRDVTIYNRFFRTAIQKSTKNFFYENDQINIENIYHDEGAEKNHPFFPWHSIQKLDTEDEKLGFACNKVTFIDSDHRVEEGSSVHSHFVQFIDLILGCSFNCLHYSSENENKLGIALQAKPLLKRIIKCPGNKNSGYNYFQRQKIEFFPQENLCDYEEDSLLREVKRNENFYTERELLIKEHKEPPLSF